MSDGDALLCAILSHPDEDTPRLMYADWLDENGQPERAEFVRVQCEFSRRFPNLARPERSDHPAALLARRERELFTASFQTRWWPLCGYGSYGIEEIREWGYSNPAFYIRRGFVESVTCTAADWLASACAIYWHPEQMVKCPAPPEHRRYYQRPVHDTNCRGGCKGTGRIRRPFVTTAHPIRRVTLTTEPDLPDDWGSGAVLRILEEHYPGIRFTLPA